MKLGEARKLLSYIAITIMALSLSCLLFTSVMYFTLADTGFVRDKLITNSLVTECKEQLSRKYEMLERESNIPKRVFEAMASDIAVREALSANFDANYSYDEKVKANETTAKNAYNLALEYLDGNKIEYNNSDVKKAADKAARIYSETVEIKGLNSIVTKLQSNKSLSSGLSLLTLILIVMCSLILFILYSDMQRAVYNACAGLLSGSFGTIIACAITLISNPVSKMNITPQILADGQSNILTAYIGCVMIAAAIIAGVSAGLTVYYNKQFTKKSSKHVGE